MDNDKFKQLFTEALEKVKQDASENVVPFDSSHLGQGRRIVRNRSIGDSVSVESMTPSEARNASLGHWDRKENFSGRADLEPHTYKKIEPRPVDTLFIDGEQKSIDRRTPADRREDQKNITFEDRRSSPRRISSKLDRFFFKIALGGIPTILIIWAMNLR